jgi:hypothetical protein
MVSGGNGGSGSGFFFGEAAFEHIPLRSRGFPPLYSRKISWEEHLVLLEGATIGYSWEGLLSGYAFAFGPNQEP